MFRKLALTALFSLGAISCYQEKDFSPKESLTVSDDQFVTESIGCSSLIEDSGFNNWPSKYKNSAFWNWEKNKAHREAIEDYFRGAKGSHFPQSREVSTPSLAKVMKSCGQEIVLIDVRDEQERDVSTISLSISLEEFEDLDPEQWENKTLIFYCTIGHRSGLITQEYREEGHQAFNLLGGVLAWSHGNHPFVNSKGNKTKEVHVYGEDWDFLEETHSPIY